MKPILTSKRLALSELSGQDTPFIYQLFNDPDCLRFIGDRGINNLASAKVYLNDKLINSYQIHGFGLYKVTKKNDNQAMGICGLVRRDEINPPDIGFAFLPNFRSGGYCTEAAQAVLNWVREESISDEVLAYTNLDNHASIRVLEKIGLRKQAVTTLPGQDFQSMVFKINLT